MTMTITPAWVATAALPDAYITRTQHSSMVRTACIAILTTSAGAAASHAAVAEKVGCLRSTVARVKRELKDLGLLGAVPGNVPNVVRAPGATFDNLRIRINDLLDCLSQLEIGEAGVAEAVAEAHELRSLVYREGTLRFQVAAVRQRLTKLEMTAMRLTSIAALRLELAELEARLAALG